MLTRSRLLLVSACFLVLIPLWVGIFLPSQRLQPDGLDELARIEASEFPLSPKHPATEASLWLGMSALRSLGFAGKAIRPVQLWNSVWLSLALAGLLVFARAWRAPSRLAAFAVLPFLVVSLHLAADPFLAYWPPGLAAFCWALVLARAEPDRGRFAALAGLLVAMVFFNPILFLALPLPAFFYAWGSTPWRARLKRLGVLLLLPALSWWVFLLATGAGRSADQPFGATRAFFGTFTPEMVGEGASSLLGAALVPETELVFYQPAHGATLHRVAAVLVVAIFAFTLGALLRARRRARSWPWLVSALLATVVIAWWAPLQRFFYLLPIWQLVAAWLDDGELGATSEVSEPQGLRAVLATALPWLLVVVLASVNLTYYLAPVQKPDPRRAWIEACAAKFEPADRLFLPLFGDFTFKYFGGIDTTSLLGVYRHRAAGRSTLEELAEMLAERQQAGGKIYFQVPKAGQRWVPQRVGERVELDYREEDVLTRFVWGQEVDCGPARFRRLLEVR